MDKQLIERIALEVANEVTPEFVWKIGCGHECGVCKHELYEFAASFLARIDAERGKEAVAYLRFWAGRMVSPDGGVECDEGLEVCEEGEVGADGEKARPVFLSPTIPKGMATVPIDSWKDAYAAFQGAFDTPQMRRFDQSEYAQDARKRMRDFNDVMLAAQGERNAD